MADSDPANAAWQRDLSVSFIKLGDLATAQGILAEAHERFLTTMSQKMKD
jgi:hypothetical protein